MEAHKKQRVKDRHDGSAEKSMKCDVGLGEGSTSGLRSFSNARPATGKARLNSRIWSSFSGCRRGKRVGVGCGAEISGLEAGEAKGAGFVLFKKQAQGRVL